MKMFDEPTCDLDSPTVFLVNQRCIEEGKKGDESRCIVALALENAGGTNPIVHEEGICLFTYLKKRHIGVCESLASKIDDFDNDREVKPFCFNLRRVKSFDVDDWLGLSEYDDMLYKSLGH